MVNGEGKNRTRNIYSASFRFCGDLVEPVPRGHSSGGGMVAVAVSDSGHSAGRSQRKIRILRT